MLHGSLESFKSSKVQTFKVLLFFVFLNFELLNPLNLEPTFAQANFYERKTIRIIVGYQPGDNHDQWARTYARFMGKYLPGHPNFIIQNMPGAGSMIAANHIYTMTKPDGLTLGSFGGALIMAQLTGRKEVQFDWPKYAWIGTPIALVICSTCAAMRRTRALINCARPTIHRVVRLPEWAAPATIFRGC